MKIIKIGDEEFALKPLVLGEENVIYGLVPLEKPVAGESWERKFKVGDFWKLYPNAICKINYIPKDSDISIYIEQKGIIGRFPVPRDLLKEKLDITDWPNSSPVTCVICKETTFEFYDATHPHFYGPRCKKCYEFSKGLVDALNNQPNRPYNQQTTQGKK
jgi:hypothetical protein